MITVSKASEVVFLTLNIPLVSFIGSKKRVMNTGLVCSNYQFLKERVDKAG